MVDEEYKILKFANFKDFDKWDVKRLFVRRINSQYQILLLKNLINDESHKEHLSKRPEEEFGILGVSNEIGMFDAYTEKGKNINQPYKVVKNDFIAYNPYRVNVGSIGIKKDNLKNSYISSACVVFSTKTDLLPDYLYMLMHTSEFNQLIRDNTTGSVRQTLSFESLGAIKIPVPSKSEQQKLVDDYNKIIAKAEGLEKQADQIDEKIENYIFLTLGINIPDKKSKNEQILHFSSFKDLFNWDAKNGYRTISPQGLLQSDKYKNVPLLSVYKMNPATSFPKELKDVSFLPMECISDTYGNVISQKSISAKTKGYTKFKNGDVIFAKITPCMQNGKCAVIKNLDTEYGMGSTEFHVFRPTADKVIPEYLHFLLRTKLVRNVAMEYFTGSSGQQRVSTAFFEHLTLPLIPVDSKDNKEITQKQLVKVVTEMQENIYRYRKEAEKLRKKAKTDFESAIFMN